MENTKTIAQQLKVKDFPFTINDSEGNEIYYEDSTGFWHKRELDSKGNTTYYESSSGYWYKKEYDSNRNIIYFEESTGYIEDNRKIPEYTMEELVDKIGNFKLKK